MTILVTGGAGYIGSHAVQRLLRDGHDVVAIDTLFRGHARAMHLLARAFPGRLTFIHADVADRALVEGILRARGIRDVLHFAAMAYVGESVEEPLRYYRNNTLASLALIEACDRAQVERLVFSSTAATYGEPDASRIPIREDCPQHPINPYGASKLAVERMLADWCASRARAGRPVAVACLRYFNVAGSDASGLLGEDHHPETHLVPLVLQAAVGVREAITIFGADYPTPDGTCVRDYIHVEDLVEAHIRVLGALRPGEWRAYNLGTGRGASVREVIDACRRATGREITERAGARRPGDPPELTADPGAIARDLGWKARVTSIEDMAASAWRWMLAHPRGYDDGAGGA
ncbi:MAG: UDP-glucose 4-epimerase GalE [Phycisphaerales bacterium]|nr:UDP-glucose 4-epimerase GalE [Phycisphaerales bacterium]